MWDKILQNKTEGEGLRASAIKSPEKLDFQLPLQRNVYFANGFVV